MITLYQYVPAWELPDISPFCIKVETYLRLADLPFRSVVADARKAPKKKLPYVDDAGTIVCDSRQIIDHFEAKLERPLDAGLGPRERATATAFRALLEEDVYFQALYLRWQLDESWEIYKPILQQYAAALGIPGFVASLLLRSVRKQVLRDLWGQGSGRHSREQIEARLCQALDAVSAELGDRPYFLGARPRAIDATLYAFLAALLIPPFDSRPRRHAQSLANLCSYTERMRAELFEPAAGPKALAAERVGNAA